jgi:hypothetical protein
MKRNWSISIPNVVSLFLRDEIEQLCHLNISSVTGSCIPATSGVRALGNTTCLVRSAQEPRLGAATLATVHDYTSMPL